MYSICRLANNAEEIAMPPTKYIDSKHTSELEREIDVTTSELNVAVTSDVVLFSHTIYTATINPGWFENILRDCLSYL